MHPGDDPDHHSSYGLRLWSCTPTCMDRFHLHADLELNHIDRGGLDYLIGGRPWRMEAGHTALFWAGIPHRLMAVDPGTTGIWGTMPVAWLLGEEARSVGQALLAGRLLGRQEVDDGVFLGRLEAALALGGLDAAEARCLLQARCLALARDVVPRRIAAPAMPRKGQRGNALHHVMRLAEHLAAHATEADLNIEAAATSCGLTPRHASTLFRQAVGMGPHLYLTTLRVAEVQRRLLTGSERRILDFALDAGFGSSSRFYASFREITGLNPVAWVRRHRHGTTQTTMNRLTSKTHFPTRRTSEVTRSL